MKIAVAFLYVTTNTHMNWFQELPHVIATTRDEEMDATHVRVSSQSQLTHVRWSKDHNHDYDNVPLQLVRIANKTLRFDWLVVSDGDTCFDVEKLNADTERAPL